MVVQVDTETVSKEATIPQVEETKKVDGVEEEDVGVTSVTEEPVDDDAVKTLDPVSLQQELNEILEAWFELVSDEDIQAYQQLVEEIRGERVAERALSEPSLAPMFELHDQNGALVQSRDILQQGKPIVLIFYRGKWCPHCNCTLMHYANKLKPELDKRQAKMIAISPMMPDGTALIAEKKGLDFSVCSDPGSEVARQFGITFVVSPTSQEYMTKWGEHVPSHNASQDWEIPLPAVYVIGTDGRIVWSFLDNDPGTRAEPGEILEQIDMYGRNKQFRQKVLAAKGLLSDDALSTSSGTSKTKETAAPCYRIRGEDTDAAVDAAQDQQVPIKKKKKMFNRKIGFVTRTLSMFRKKTRSGKKNDESDTRSCGDVQSVGSSNNDDTHSIKSEEPGMTSNNRNRFYRGKEQPPMEFLMQYVGGYN